MPSENPVTIGAILDPTELVEGMRLGTQQFAEALDELKTDLVEASTSSQRAFRQITDEAKSMAANVSPEFARVAAATVAHNQAQAQLRAALTLTRDKTQDAATTAQLLASSQAKEAATAKELAAAMEAAGIGFDTAAEKQEKVRASAALMSEEIGIKIPKHLRGLIADLPVVGTLMESAFSVFAVIGFADVLAEVPGKIQELTDKLMGWDEASQKAYEDQRRINREQIKANDELAQKQAQANISGLAGVGRAQAEQDELNQRIKKTTAELADQQRQYAQILSKLEEKPNPGGASTEVNLTAIAFQKLDGWIEQTTKHLQEQKEALAASIIEKQTELNSLKGPDSTKAAITLSDTQFADLQRTESSKTEAVKAGETARADLKEQAARQNYTLELITLDQEIAALKAAEAQKYAALRASLEKQKELAIAKAARDTSDPTADITRINGEEEAAASRHQAKLSEIEFAGAQQRKQQEDAIAQAQIAAAEKKGDLIAQLDRDKAQELYASHKINAQQETQLLIQAENEQYNAEREAIQRRITEAEKEPQKNRALLVSLNAELESLEVQHQARMTQIRAEGDKKTLSDEKAMLNERVAAAEQSANRELQDAKKLDNQRLSEHAISLAQWGRDEQQAINKWFSEQQQVLTQSLSQAKAMYGEQSKEYQALQDKLKALDRERADDLKQILDRELQEWRQAANAISSTMFTGLNSMLQHQSTFAQAAKQTWNDLAMSAIQQIEKQAEKWIADHVIMAAFSKMFHLGEITEQQTESSTKLATSVATNDALVTSDAGVAAAGTLAWWSAVNPLVAPAMAAAAFAETLGYISAASAANGMVSKEEQFAFIHKNEMVLPAPLSLGFQNIIGRMNGAIAPAQAAGDPGFSGSSAPGKFGDVHFSMGGIHLPPGTTAANAKQILDVIDANIPTIARKATQHIKANLNM